MNWEDVAVGDLIEYQILGSKSNYGIYLGIQFQTDPVDESLYFMTNHLIYKTGLDFVPINPGYEIKVAVRSALKKAKG